MERLDLHMHSIASLDGQYPMVDICRMALKGGINTIALSDHNCISEVKNILSIGSNYGLKLIPAIEIDASNNGIDYHILGYGIDLDNPIFDEIEQNYLNQARSAGVEMMEALVNAGFDFKPADVEAISAGGIVTGEKVAEILLKNDVECRDKRLDPYRNGGDRSARAFVNFYWDYCSSGKIGFAPIKFPSVEKIINLLHQQGALAILAHPGQNLHENLVELNSIKHLGIDGLEAFSSYHNHQQVDFYTKWARENNLVITCGSDFHGATKPDINLGDHGMSDTEQEKLSHLFERYAQAI